MEIFVYLALTVIGAAIGLIGGYMLCQADIRYYRSIVFAYEQQKTRKLLG